MDTQQVYGETLNGREPSQCKHILSKYACILTTKDCLDSERKKRAFLVQCVINIKKEQLKFSGFYAVSRCKALGDLASGFLPKS